MDFNESTPIMSFCGNCGKKLLANATFCAYCGAPIPKIEDGAPPKGDFPIFLSKSVEIAPRQPFLENFRGVLTTPKERMSTIVSSPNYVQPLTVSLIVAILSVIALGIFLSKYEITFSTSFFESLPLDVGTEEFDYSEFMGLFMVIYPIFTPIIYFVYWLLFSLILWVLNAIFASDLPSSQRNFRTMATIVGWAQVPMIIQQIVLILNNAFFLSSGGQLIFHSMGEMETIPSGGDIGLPLDFFLLGIEVILLVWSLVLIYYAIKSLGSSRSNPFLICMIYGLLVLFLPF